MQGLAARSGSMMNLFGAFGRRVVPPLTFMSKTISMREIFSLPALDTDV